MLRPTGVEPGTWFLPSLLPDCSQQFLASFSPSELRVLHNLAECAEVQETLSKSLVSFGLRKSENSGRNSKKKPRAQRDHKHIP